jgi:hypothetical protein
MTDQRRSGGVEPAALDAELPGDGAPPTELRRDRPVGVGRPDDDVRVPRADPDRPVAVELGTERRPRWLAAVGDRDGTRVDGGDVALERWSAISRRSPAAFTSTRTLFSACRRRTFAFSTATCCRSRTTCLPGGDIAAAGKAAASRKPTRHAAESVIHFRIASCTPRRPPRFLLAALDALRQNPGT